MFKLERIRKLKIISILLCILFFILTIIGFFRGGSILLFSGKLYQDYEAAAIQMAVSGALFLVLLLGTVALHLLQKDFEEHFKYLETKIKSETK